MPLLIAFCLVGFCTFFPARAFAGSTVGNSTLSPAQIEYWRPPSFQADLTQTITLQEGSGAPTFTRADGADRRATVTDSEGIIRPVKAGEARFEGARRVENLILDAGSYKSEPIGSSWPQLLTYTVTGVSFSSVTYGTDPVTNRPYAEMTLSKSSGSGGNGALFFDGGGYYHSLYNRSFQWSLYIAKTAAAGTVDVKAFIETYNSGYSWLATYSSADIVSSLGSSFQRYNAAADPVVDSTAAYSRWGISVSGMDAGESITLRFTGIQYEETTGQTNKNPGEYVSAGVLSAPYHGANVDGVKYFTTQNGNSVASNVVTEATGPAIPDAALKGYLAEGSRTNMYTYSEQLDNVFWMLSGILAFGSGSVVNDLSAPDGSLTAERLTETSTNAAHALYTASQMTVSNATAYTRSAYMKAGTGSYGAINIIGTSNRHATGVFDLVNGTVGETHTNGGTLLGTSIVNAGNGWYRCSVSWVVATDNRMWGGVSMAGAATGNTYTADGYPTYLGTGKSMYVWGMQMEQASFPSSYIPTTSASVTRAADSLSYPTANNLNTANGTISLETTTSWSNDTDTSAYWIGDSGDYELVRLWHWSSSSNHIGADRQGGGSVRNNADGMATVTKGTMMRLAMKYDSAEVELFRDGASLGADTTLTLPYDAFSGMMYVGRSLGGGNSPYATIKNIKIWDRALSDGQLTALTAGGKVKRQIINANQNNELTAGLVGFWSFNGPDVNATMAYDRSGQGNHGTLSGGPVVTRGKVGQALRFDGSAQFVETVPDLLSGMTNVTVAFWAKGTGNPWGQGDGGLSTFMEAGRIFFRGQDDGRNQDFSISNPFSASEWNYIVVVSNLTAVSLYKNGILDQGPLSTTDRGAIRTGGINKFAIGRVPDGSGGATSYFNGSIDDFRIYNRALSAEEIRALYEMGR